MITINIGTKGHTTVFAAQSKNTLKQSKTKVHFAPKKSKASLIKKMPCFCPKAAQVQPESTASLAKKLRRFLELPAQSYFQGQAGYDICTEIHPKKVANLDPVNNSSTSLDYREILFNVLYYDEK